MEIDNLAGARHRWDGHIHKLIIDHHVATQIAEICKPARSRHDPGRNRMSRNHSVRCNLMC